ncbi:Gfo/Idh/MocA family oxidoreductase [Paenibacillus pasadenensis]|uniref:Gfo/Idh/MocA family protein n=1 Tax=Paenibacillus pasadenensis TaxID=217090 RepID=UPI0020417FD3|nr:Gfo/Idh/MocA family oxidoreductase [Paenibacillus pasadenensis]MCM3748759.1 Gfo/Idh/MocA family oxidoreductase [Paenibacillus pasadenensis]
MRAVQIGVGSMTFGRTWRKGLMEIEGVETVGLIDPNPAFLEEARGFYGLPAESCASWASKEFYEQVQADFIIDSTPHSFHYKNAIEAMRCGLNVIVVKPMSDTVATAATMVKEAERLGRKLVVAQQIRFMQPVLQLKKLIAEGIVGDVAYIQADSYFTRQGPVRDKWYQPHPLLLECAIHQFDLIRWMTGLEPESVMADAWNMPWNDEVWGKKTAIALFQMNNGSRALFRGLSTEQPGESYPGHWEIEGDKGVLSLIKGNIYLGGERIWPAEEISEAELDLPALNAEVLKDAIAYFAGNESPVLSGADNLKSLRMAFGCMDSSEKGQRIQL